MLSTTDLWWTTPLQMFASLGMAVNFGGSVLQSPLIMPMFRLSTVPAHHADTYLLSNSEHFFPPLHAACTASNLILAGIAYWNRQQSQFWAEKAPLLMTAAVFGIATTVYALTVMVPMNKRMANAANQLSLQNDNVKAEQELRRLQQRWAAYNYGRAALMLSGAIVGVNALLVGAKIR